jgi:hypothetical protein
MLLLLHSVSRIPKTAEECITSGRLPFCEGRVLVPSASVSVEHSAVLLPYCTRSIGDCVQMDLIIRIEEVAALQFLSIETFSSVVSLNISIIICALTL